MFGVGGEDWSSNDKTQFSKWAVPFQVKEFIVVQTDLVGTPSLSLPDPWEHHRNVEDVPVEADLSNIVAISDGGMDGANAGRWPFPVKAM